MDNSNKSLLQTTEKKCPNCGSTNVFGLREEQGVGSIRCGCGTVRRFECLECGEQFLYSRVFNP